jgi:hypothetical protein
VRGHNPPGGVCTTGGIDAKPGALERIIDAILVDKATAPVAGRSDTPTRGWHRARWLVTAPARRRTSPGRRDHPRGW